MTYFDIHTCFLSLSQTCKSMKDTLLVVLVSDAFHPIFQCEYLFSFCVLNIEEYN